MMALKWYPFCGSTSCQCMEPNPRVCEEFVEADDPWQRRCGRCGWPDVRHGVQRELKTRYGRAWAKVGQRWHYYRQAPDGRLEKWHYGNARWEEWLGEATFQGRLEDPAWAPMEECGPELMPDYRP